jgi:hypothetical protein
MYCIPKQLVGLYSYKDLTGSNAKTKEEFEEGLKKLQKEPNFKTIAKATYNFDYLMSALKTAKKLKTTYITIEISEEGILRVSIKHIKGDAFNQLPEHKFRYYLAPIVED